jgi:hypothetical protein
MREASIEGKRTGEKGISAKSIRKVTEVNIISRSRQFPSSDMRGYTGQPTEVQRMSEISTVFFGQGAKRSAYEGGMVDSSMTTTLREGIV